MLDTLRDLVAHKGHANAALLAAIRPLPEAVADGELWALLHHVLLANRFWWLTVSGAPFVLEAEAAAAPSFDGLVRRYAATQADEEAWFATATAAALERTLASPSIPGGRCTVAQAYVQVCLHTHGHRSQCAPLLRGHGGTPPVTDFVVWLTHRERADWPGIADGIR